MNKQLAWLIMQKSPDPDDWTHEAREAEYIKFEFAGGEEYLISVDALYVLLGGIGHNG